jgi:hypothetical protein
MIVRPLLNLGHIAVTVPCDESLGSVAECLHQRVQRVEHPVGVVDVIEVLARSLKRDSPPSARAPSVPDVARAVHDLSEGIGFAEGRERPVMEVVQAGPCGPLLVRPEGAMPVVIGERAQHVEDVTPELACRGATS